MPVIGVIKPGARAAVAAAAAGPIGVIGTAGTIASNAYARAIQRARAGARGRCSVPARCSCRWWRKGGSTIPAAELVAAEYLAPLQRGRRGRAGAGLHPLSAAQAAAAAGHGAGRRS